MARGASVLRVLRFDLVFIIVKRKLLQPGGASLVALRKHKAGSDGQSY
jgi:hypothetical protein